MIGRYELLGGARRLMIGLNSARRIVRFRVVERARNGFERSVLPAHYHSVVQGAPDPDPVAGQRATHQAAAAAIISPDDCA
jgi:hypothetical protein